MSEPAKPLTLVEQLDMMTATVRISYKIITDLGSKPDADLETLRAMMNSFNMQMKECTNIQRAISAAGKGRKSKLVTELTGQANPSSNDAPT